ncbi:MAG: hypothetical protein ACRDPE_11130 [Solirubrobacterales bacterium]
MRFSGTFTAVVVCALLVIAPGASAATTGGPQSATAQLKNPDLGSPVYWLGRIFRHHDGSGPSTFLYALGRDELARPLPGQMSQIIYTPELILDTWKPEAWRRFARTTVGKALWTWRCTRSRSVQLPRGRAVIYASYRRDYSTCPTSRPRHYSAHVFLPGAVVAIGEATCATCLGNAPAYESFGPIGTIARGLRRWRPGEEAAAAN